ncbi:MAG: insulinase family protein [Alicyclobacillaceae bacterium]|nr:insulinase family protein [Alicyclobacillaceae bacterium]
MSDFQSIHQGRLAVHVLAEPRFQTRHVSVRLVQPLRRETVTGVAVLPYLWMEGTGRLPTADAVWRKADELYGAVLRSGIGKRGDRHVLESYVAVPDEVSLAGASGLFDEAVDLALDLVTDPAHSAQGFPGRHVAREKMLHRRRIEAVFDDKVAYAFERCVEEVCRGEAAGLPRLGYVEDLDRLDGLKLWSIHEEVLQTADVHVYVVGAVPEDRGWAEALCERVSQRWPVTAGAADLGQRRPAAVQALPERGGEVQRITDRQNVNQGKLDLGFRTGVGYDSDEYPAMLMCNGVLGGFPHSKLFVNVREKASLAYYASSRLDALTGVVVVQTGIQVDLHERAMDIIMQQVKALQDGDITDDEMELTKQSLRNQYLQLMDQPVSLAEMHFVGLLGGRVRSIPEVLAAVDAVGKADVVRAAQRLRLDTVYFLRDAAEVRASAGDAV